MRILALDLGKFHSMACFFNGLTQEARFQAVATNRRYLTALLQERKGRPGGDGGLWAQRLDQ